MRSIVAIGGSISNAKSFTRILWLPGVQPRSEAFPVAHFPSTRFADVCCLCPTAGKWSRPFTLRISSASKMKQINASNIGSLSLISSSARRCWRKPPDRQGTSPRRREFLSATEFTWTRNFHPATFGEAKMIESKNRRAGKDTSVREIIEEERERDKRKEDEVANSSDDSFPASDPPSFTGVTSAADIERKKRANPD